ncbi:MAG: TIGR02588 family protein [Cyanobacteria bacterium P01_D01_bin.128]
MFDLDSPGSERSLSSQSPQSPSPQSPSPQSPSPEALAPSELNQAPQDVIAPSAEPSKPRSLAEWITLGLATLILSVLVGLILYDWQINQNRPPAFQIEVTQSARITDGHYYVPFSIKNTGGRIARTVQVTAELQIDGQVSESGEQQIDFLSGSEKKRGNFVFDQNPQQGELLIRVASYGLP